MTTRPAALSDVEINLALQSLEGWAYDEDDKSFKKNFQFKDFSEAFGFMNAIAMLADNMDHHPEWSNIYNKVNVRLTTHDVGAVSAFDVVMATYMNEMAG
jgi:4a-hydroxytetrahydrobiopterin dehydratase